MARIRLTRAEQRELKKSGHVVGTIPGASGPQTSTYYDPKTGQEFHGLPIDEWSLQRYIRVKGWMLGPAPAAMKRKWKRILAKRSDPAEKHMIEGQKIADEASKTAAESSETRETLKQMQEQIATLTALVKGQLQPDATTTPAPEAPAEAPEPESEPEEAPEQGEQLTLAL
jgi:hypothetical protein